MAYSKSNPFNQAIGDKIRTYRENAGETQAEFAEKIGVKRATLSLIECGEQPPSLEVLAKVIQITKMDMAEILNLQPKNHMILDTNIIINCPELLRSLTIYCDMIYIPRTVERELENQKNSTRENIRKDANLALNKIIEMRKNHPKQFVIKEETGEGSNNDDRIFSVALKIASDNPNDDVYLLTNDKDFQLKDAGKIINLKVITSRDFERIFRRDENFNIPLSQKFFSAVLKKDLETVKQLSEKNIDVNYVDTRSGYTPLIQAVRNRDCKMVGFLLTLPQIKINAVDHKKHRLPALSHAVQISHLGLVKQMIMNGANVNEPSQSDKNPYNTPLMIASYDGKLDFVKLLVEHGACINQQDKGNGFTALIKAAFQNHADIVKFLLDNNADATICSFEKKKAIDYAREKNDENRYRAVIELLEE